MSSDLTFITNEKGQTLADRFSVLLGGNTRFLDCLVGYFYLSGFHKLHPSLTKTEKVRILIGIKTDGKTYELVQEAEQQELVLQSHAQARAAVADAVRGELETSEDTATIEDGVRKFVEWITSGKLEIKAYPSERIHAKLYVMTFVDGHIDKGRVVTGSSNFTEAGLVDNLEFNVELKNRSDYDFALAKFNELWAKAVEVSNDFVQIIETQSPYAQFTPHELYLKFLYEYFRNELNLPEELDGAYLPNDFKKLKYQEDAVLNAARVLDEFGGVFLADVVGLGKTFMSALLARHLDGRSIVIAPPHLLDEHNPGSWPNVFREFGVRGFKCESIGKLASLLEDDLDPGAVEIAKLRLWLSMVVDEDNITDIQPLPNLDYKIMQGNSLLEEFHGVRLLDEKLLQPPSEARNSEIAELKSRISSLSQEFVRLHGEGRKSAAAKLATEQDIKRLKKRLAALVNPDDAQAAGQGELNQQTSWASLKRIQEIHEKFFDEDSRTEKDKLRRELDALEWHFMEATLREQGHEEALADLKRASATHRKPFFLWRLHFGEVFQQRGGFDVVIANPPYVRHEEIKEFKPAFQRTFECHTGTADLFVYFYERAVKLLRRGGALAFITSNKYYRAAYGEKLRGYLARELTLQQLIDFGDAPVFEAIAYASILTGTRNTPPKDTAPLGYTWEKDVSFERIVQVMPERGLKISQIELGTDGWRLDSPAELRLLQKLRQDRKTLKEFVGSRVSRGLTTGLNEAFVVEGGTRDRLVAEHKSSAKILKPYLRGKDLERWRAAFSDQYIVKIESSDNADHPWSGNPEKAAEKIFASTFPAIHSHFQKFRAELIERDDQGKYFWEQRSCKYWREFEQPKIVSTKISIRPTFALDSDGRYLGNTSYFFPAAQAGRFLLGLLNSSLFFCYARKVFVEKQGGWFEVQPDGLESFPVPAASPENQKAVEGLVDRILAAKAQDASADVTALEQEINQQVYELYSLTKDEIKMVEDSAK